ncbi:TPA: hypothetical protein ACQ53F_001033 [Legionella pneumophila]
MPSRRLVWNLMLPAKASRGVLRILKPKRILDIDCFLYNPYL